MDGQVFDILIGFTIVSTRQARQKDPHGADCAGRNLSDVVTVGKNADVSSFPVDASLRASRRSQLTLETLLYGFVIVFGKRCGNDDCGVYLRIGEAFVEEMNDRAKNCGGQYAFL